jgi:hypothetical protein
MDTSIIAKVCHEANMVICQFNGDYSQKSWNEAEPWQRESAIKGVEFRINNPTATPADQHQAWSDEKIADGWVYGEVKDAVAKTHPCLVPYDQLPVAQQAKDHLFQGIVDSLKGFIKEPEIIEVAPIPVADLTPQEIVFAAHAEIPVDNGEPTVAEIASAHAEETQAADTITADTLIPAPEFHEPAQTGYVAPVSEEPQLWGGEETTSPEAPFVVPVTEEVLAENPELVEAGVAVGETIEITQEAIVEPAAEVVPEPVVEEAPAPAPAKKGKKGSTTTPEEPVAPVEETAPAPEETVIPEIPAVEPEAPAE